VFIKVSGECAPKVLASAKDLVTFDPSGKVAVADLTGLDAAQLPTGKPAPIFDLENLAGQKVSLPPIQRFGSGARFLGLVVRALLEDPAGHTGFLRLGVS